MLYVFNSAQITQPGDDAFIINFLSVILFQDGVILGADTRATEGPIVADKNCEKIHYMAPNIYCCGAGTAADTEAVTGNEFFIHILALFAFLEIVCNITSPFQF